VASFAAATLFGDKLVPALAAPATTTLEDQFMLRRVLAIDTAGMTPLEIERCARILRELMAKERLMSSANGYYL
jgi:N12 class adenine-specific DNA methylase